MAAQYEVLNTDITDLEMVFRLFDQSILYQQRKGYITWENYDKSAIIKDIENKNQYKIIINSTPAIVFSACYTDKLLWREMDKGESIYLHRIVVNPECKGQKLFGVILAWAINHAKQKGLSNIRMDTWAVNSNIIDYYKGFGFRFVENYTTADIPELPVHNRNLALALLEYKL